MPPLIKEIEEVFHKELTFIVEKFNNVRSKKDVLKWLNNFDDDEKIISLDLIRLYTFITEEEVRSMCNELMKEVLETSGTNSYIYMMPVGRYGKSSSLLAYYLKKSHAFKKLLSDEKISFLDNESLLDSTVFYSSDRFLFFDDFFGTGFSLIKELRRLSKHQNSSLSKIVEKAEAYGLFYMPQCMKNLSDNKFSIKINAKRHDPLFGQIPNLFENNFVREWYKKICHDNAFRKNLFITHRDKHNLGYKDCEAFISFAHTTPNNTLPIIWSDKSKWFPIFGASDTMIFNTLKERKYQISKLAIDNEFKIKFEETINGKIQLTNYLIFGIIYFINKKWPEPKIIRNLGIDIDNFDFLMEIAKNKNLLTFQGSLFLTKEGEEFLNKILLVISDANRKKQESSINKIAYIAKNFSG